jgi:4-amino-4-deoxychorismate lyase
MDGVYYNLPLHAARLEKACVEYLGLEKGWNLSEYLEAKERPAAGLFKCRVLYDERTIHAEFLPYHFRPARSLKIVYDDTISYEYKFVDRRVLDEHYKNRGQCDDILIIRNDLVTDSFSANIIFNDNGRWITPASCLLKGTMRQLLIDEGHVTERAVHSADISGFASFKLINAMMGNESPEIPVTHIVC